MNKLIGTFLIGLMVSLGTFAQEDINLKEYYWPYETFTKPKVYRYADLHDRESFEYWHLTYDATASTLTIAVYDQDADHLRTYVYNIDKETGATLTKMTKTVKGVTANCELTGTSDYKWNSKADMIVSVAYGIRTTSINEYRKRVFDAELGPKPFLTSKYKTFRFLDTYTITKKEEGVDQSEISDYYDHVNFSVGLGMHSYKRHFKNKAQNFILQEILEEKDWNKIAKSKGK